MVDPKAVAIAGLDIAILVSDGLSLTPRIFSMISVFLSVVSAGVGMILLRDFGVHEDVVSVLPSTFLIYI